MVGFSSTPNPLLTPPVIISMQENDTIEISESELNRKINSAVEDKFMEIEERVEDLENEIDILHSRADHMSDYEDELQNDLEKIQNQWDSYREVLLSSGTAVDLSPAEKMMNGANWDDLNIEKSANRERAMDVITNWKRLSNPTTGGSKLNISDIDRMVDGVNNYQTSKRVGQQVQKLTDSKIVLDDLEHADGKILKMDKTENLVTDIEVLFD